MKIWLSTEVAALFVICSLIFGQTVQDKRFEGFPRFAVTEGELDSQGFPTSGAKFCLTTGKNRCYQMPSHKFDGSERLMYEFGLEPKAKVLPLASGGAWAFFSAVFSAGGSGTLTRLAILRYKSDGVLVNLLPYVALTNVSEHAIWTVPSASPYPILVDADFIWSNSEAHFARHYFRVDVWRFDIATDGYKRAVSYQTTKKYEGGDSGPISVLGSERAEILRRLNTK